MDYIAYHQGGRYIVVRFKYNKTVHNFIKIDVVVFAEVVFV